MNKTSLRRFLYISRADTPLRRLFDRVSGFTMLVVLLGAAFFGTGWCIARFVNGATAVLTRVIDWCGYHPFVPFAVIALMIVGCVWLDYRSGE